MKATVNNIPFQYGGRCCADFLERGLDAPSGDIQNSAVRMELEQLLYPLSRYSYKGIRFYYAYGNTPAQDYLQNCSDVKEPAVLVLGCGDIRSCFYSLWKNFDVDGLSQFDGVHFFLNDISAAILARNILFLYLCLQMPEGGDELKLRLSGIWAIWYCHELYPEHSELLNNSLRALCKYSQAWSSGNNPLYPMVKFSSPATLSEIQKVWKMWLECDIGIASVKEMHSSRQAELMTHSQVYKTESDISSFVLGSTEIPFERSNNSEIFDAQKAEVLMYSKTGSAYAESVLGLKLPSCRTDINFTLFEREDGKYTLHYGSMPFRCFYHTVDFSIKRLKSLKVAIPTDPTLLPVESEYFKSLPYLANSVQQFSLWVRSAHKVLKSSKQYCINFTFDCSHAITFCQLQASKDKHLVFDLVYTSNLMDHLGPPNLILSALPLMKNSGLLSTASLVKAPTSTFSQYLLDCFGFDSKLFPIIFGVRCINYEGESYASSVTVKPSPFTIRDMTFSHYEKLVLWEKIPSSTIPVVCNSSQQLSDAITGALVKCIKVSVYPLLKTPRIPQVTNHLCVETAVKVLQAFMSNCMADFTPQFWSPLSKALQQAIKPYLHSMQTQLLLHGIHMHLTVTEETCPICTRVPLSSSIGLYCTRISLQDDFKTPNFFVVVHQEECNGAEYLRRVVIEGGDAHIFDCISLSEDDRDFLELYFYAPLFPSTAGYKATLVLTRVGEIKDREPINFCLNVPKVPTIQLSSWLVAYTTFKFSQPVLSPLKHFKLVTFGTVTSHLSDGDSSELAISVVQRVARASTTNKLVPKKLSFCELQLSIGKLSCSLKFPYPIDYDKTNIKYSRHEKKLVIHVPRTAQQFQNEKPLFIVNPDNELSLLPHLPTEEAMVSMSGQQFTKTDRSIMKWCEDNSSDMPPLISLKKSLMYFFQKPNDYYFQFLPEKNNVHGMVIVNNRLFDYESRTPVIDLAFCFLEDSFVHTVAPVWVNIISSNERCDIVMSIKEYELLKEVFHYFSKRTNATCKRVTNAKSRLNLLYKHGIQKYFKRAVISLLLCDPDVFAQFFREFMAHDEHTNSKSMEELDSARTEKCENCNKFFEATMFCSGCRIVKYCTKKCQQEHWKVHKHHCKKGPHKTQAKQVLVKQQVGKSLLPFPLCRYRYCGDFNYYYAYGNTPPEDFLHSCAGVKEPAVLSLGCGDIRSCFYTLWKNFDFSISNAPKQFNGVHFVLNDCSPPILARNIVFIYLCLKLPQNLKERRKWLCAMWAVWYCHELYPQHQQILDDCLKSLLDYSESLTMWASSSNPLHNLVTFNFSTTLTEVCQVWKAWLTKLAGCVSVGKMQSERRKFLEQRSVFKNLEAQAFTVTYSATCIFGNARDCNKREVDIRIPEVVSYVNSGNCFAEHALDLDLSTSPTSVNLTLFERTDGVYTLHHASLPFICFYHSVEFSPDTLKQSGVEKKLCDGMLVKSKNFKSHPFLANSVQQFSMWIQSSSAVLNGGKHDIKFTFNEQDALNFCHEHQQCGSSQFDAIVSSNLLDHLGPQNLILSALPLLKPCGFLFTSTLQHRRFSNTVEEFLDKCFGFDSKLLPVILDARCINHEGAGYSSPVMIQPIPVHATNIVKWQQQQKLLVWQKISSHPFVMSSLPLHQPGSITDALFNSISSLTLTLLTNSGLGKPVLNCSNVETVMLILQTFVSSTGKGGDYKFWEPLTSAISLSQKLRPYLSGLQTQALLHNLHMHFVVNEVNCPLCKSIPIEMYVGLFGAELSLPLPKHFLTPNFMVLVHQSSSMDSWYLCNQAKSGKDVHIIDCIDGMVHGKTLKLQYFAPLTFIDENFNVTIAVTCMLEGENTFSTVIPTTKIESMRIEFVQYGFSRATTSLQSKSVLGSLGELTSNIYRKDEVVSEISLSDSALQSLACSSLNTSKISASEIQLSCGFLHFNLKFKYPVNYNGIAIKLSRARRNVKVTCPREIHQFEKESPMFITLPDHQLSLPPQDVSSEVMVCHSGLQMTPEERQHLDSCNRDYMMMSPITNVKESLMFFFQCKTEFHFHLIQHEGEKIVGEILVNERMFDYQHNAPAVDLAICFPIDHSCPKDIHDAWLDMVEASGNEMIKQILVDDAELEEFKKVIMYFAKRTKGDIKSAGSNSRYHDLVKTGIHKYFIRAVVYFLYCDPDHKALSVNDPNVVLSCGASRENTPSTEQLMSEYKCSFCSNLRTLKKCKECGKAQYCSKECQTKHWPVHKFNCRGSAKSENQESSATALKTMLPMHGDASGDKTILCCACCGSSVTKLLLCTRCRKIRYCGRDCQRKHWKLHKDVCNK